ncbi:MAG: diadenosine tetraphosphatase [Gammaproteobacteria bacterium CG_4_10_14_0_8_um_filter_38_16]|nr:MAG: diadenosine tetraphosphatase [Gammaproteobacteria bacterium CG_4_10_14_0_8_um_filter_38_16]PJA03169.1 MAG: diadenosine tetraphosphatase [Gammaproteobacteria bacterium CG_4_10_14_0_2_um_filter_38_22]PJB09961.1 MAG: diadenosine tetraphosphatase [Gammaproteobacteria bacterium CG_4_9_14_3_um_filter_38_9]
MSTYIIGDVQGCFDALQMLLKKVNYDPTRDQLGFVGDLVNRGLQSLETLRFITQLKNPIVVLGNHDLHLMALYFLRNQKDKFKHIDHTLQSILNADDCEKLIHFLLQQPFMYWDKKNNLAITHAGIPPQWSIDEAFSHANEIQKIMRDHPQQFFEKIYGNTPATWRNDLTSWDRTRYIVNALTRMRFCTKTGELDLDNKTNLSSNPLFRPWFEWRTQQTTSLVFGHWAALQGQCNQAHIFAIDTGCIWGGQLTALKLPDFSLFGINVQNTI